MPAPAPPVSASSSPLRSMVQWFLMTESESGWMSALGPKTVVGRVSRYMRRLLRKGSSSRLMRKGSLVLLL